MCRRCYTVIKPWLALKLAISFVGRSRPLNSAREEKLVRKSNHKEAVSEVLGLTPTSHGPKPEMPTYSACSCENNTPMHIAFEASHAEFWGFCL